VKKKKWNLGTGQKGRIAHENIYTEFGSDQKKSSSEQKKKEDKRGGGKSKSCNRRGGEPRGHDPCPAARQSKKRKKWGPGRKSKEEGCEPGGGATG